MIRFLLLAGAVVAGAPGCGTGVERAPPPGFAAPSAALAPAARRSPAAANAGSTFASPPPSQAVRDRAAVAEACRRDADRVVLYRDRGQLMREDERDARIGTDSSIYARRVETDRLGRVFERDRLAAECLEQDPRTPPSRR
jgi:hypothetical protein